MSALFGCASAIAFAWALLREVKLSPALRGFAVAVGAAAVFSASGTIKLLSGISADVALLAGAIAVLWFGSARRSEDAPSGSGRFIFIGAASLAVVALTSHIARFPDGGNDAFIIWNLRARWLYRAGANFRSAFSPEILFWTHQDYPLLLPEFVARGFALVGRESRVVPAAIAVLFTSCAVGIVVAAAPAKAKWWAGVAIATTPALVMLGATEQADLPLAVFTAVAVAMLLVKESGDLRAIAAAGAFASMAAWTKNEGLLHFSLIGIAVVLTERRGQAVVAFIAGALPFLMLLLVFKLAYAPRNDLVESFSVARAFDLERWWTLLLLILRRIVLLQAWGIHLLALVLWALFGRRLSAAPEQARWLSWFPITTIAIELGILLEQPHDLTFMFKVTIDRLLIQLWPAIVLLIACRQPVAIRQKVDAAAV